MRARGAAPLGGDQRAAFRSTGDAGNSAPAATAPQPIEAIPAKIRQRLAAEGIHSLAEWSRLSHRRRGSIFGITVEHIRLLDALAKVP
jgi:hypothetical protein